MNDESCEHVSMKPRLANNPHITCSRNYIIAAHLYPTALASTLVVYAPGFFSVQHIWPLGASTSDKRREFDSDYCFAFYSLRYCHDFEENLPWNFVASEQCDAYDVAMTQPPMKWHD